MLGWMLIEDVVNYPRENTSESWSVAEVLDVFKFDSKQRFAARGPNIEHNRHLSLPVWPYQVRANQDHSKAAIEKNPELGTATAVSFFDPRARPLLPNSEKDLTATRNGRPLEMENTRSGCITARVRLLRWPSLSKAYFLGNGPEIDSGKAHVYCSDKPLEDITYKSGVRANASFEVVVDTKIAIFLGCLFFRTTSDGILRYTIARSL